MTELRRDAILVVDIEATCWEKNTVPPGEKNEIIEVGVALLDLATLTPRDRRGILVRPVMSKVSPFCTTLTSITPELLDAEGISFADACDLLTHEYQASERLWGSWGNYDRRMFEEQTKLLGVPYPFSSNHFNIKKLFTDRDNKKKSLGMAAALAKLEIPLEGTHHRGGDDAWNIAKILASMLSRHSLDLLKKYW